jgi:hypothetical protein
VLANFVMTAAVVCEIKTPQLAHLAKPCQPGLSRCPALPASPAQPAGCEVVSDALGAGEAASLPMRPPHRRCREARSAAAVMHASPLPGSPKRRCRDVRIAAAGKPEARAEGIRIASPEAAPHSLGSRLGLPGTGPPEPKTGSRQPPVVVGSVSGRRHRRCSNAGGGT